MTYSHDAFPIEILLPRQMAEADRLTIEAGAPGIELMERAGAAVAHEAADMLPDYGRVLVVCGPGNNGGDGYVAARLLEQSAYRVTVAALDPDKPLKGDAALAAARWNGAVTAMIETNVAQFNLIIDAVFGTGITGKLVGPAADCINMINGAGIPVLAVDGPSGYDLADGTTTEPFIRAARTVTFFRLKPGHLLQPDNPCGEIKLHQIGISPDVLRHVWNRDGTISLNDPKVWRDGFPIPSANGHKYTRGHAVVVSGKASATGAARLGARGALRVGAGLVTVASPPDAVLVNAAHLTAIMLQKFRGAEGLSDLLADKRKNAVLIGPGAGVNDDTKANVLMCLGSSAHVVLDADALMSFVDTQQELYDAISAKIYGAVVLTPHAGEFKRFFEDDGHDSPAKVRMQARSMRCVVVAKGPSTIIGAPDGRIAINTNAPPTLATAGSGDVLAGFITGLLAQGMSAFEASCAAVWLHGACAKAFGPGLIAEDLPEILPQVLRTFD